MDATIGRNKVATVIKTTKNRTRKGRANITLRLSLNKPMRLFRHEAPPDAREA
jgi:hypothetical protein